MKTTEFKKKRRSLGLSQSALGKIFGVEYRTISRWERDGIPEVAALALECLCMKTEKVAEKKVA